MDAEKRKKIANIVLPTEAARKQVIEIFEELAVDKKDIQSFFSVSDIWYTLKQVWEGPDQPTIDDMIHYLDDACVTFPTTYRRNKQGSYRYIMRRDH